MRKQNEIQVSDNLLRDWLGTGTDCGVCSGFRHGPLQADGLRQGLGHHDKIKTKLAAEHPGSLKHVRVDTDMNGVVWMTGTANTQGEVDQAVAIARATEGVKSVNSKLTVQKDR